MRRVGRGRSIAWTTVVLVLVLACGAAPPASAAAPPVDSQITSGASATTEHSTRTTLEVGRRAGSTTESRGVLFFDLSDIPRHAVILSASLALQPTARQNSTPKVVNLHRLTRSFDARVTWNRATATSPWTTPGGDYDSEVIASATAGTTQNGIVVWNVTKLARSWINDGSPNHGVLLKDAPGQPANAVTFASVEGTVRDPSLYVQWTAGPGERDHYTFFDTPTPDGSTLRVNVGNGNLLLSHVDFRKTGTAFDYDLTRTYNSRNHGGWSDIVAPGWRLDPATTTLAINPDGFHSFHGPTGIIVPFERLPNGTYRAADPRDRQDFLLEARPGPHVWYVVTDLSRNIVHELGMYGELVAMYFGDERLGFSHGGYNPALSMAPIARIAEADGLETTFDLSSTDGMVRILGANPSDGSQHDYRSLLGNRLEEYDGPNGLTRYGYDANGNNLLTRITAPNGRVTQLSYDSQRRVTSIVEGPNATDPTTTFQYYNGYTLKFAPSGERTAWFYDAYDLHVTGVQIGPLPGVDVRGELRAMAEGHDRGLEELGLVADVADVERIARVALEIDGVERDTFIPSCAPSCPQQVSAPLSVSGPSLTEGSHTVRVTARGVDGQTGATETWTIVLDRTPTPAPNALRADFDAARNRAQLSWQNGPDPALPGGVPGSGLSGYVWRFVQTDGTWSAWDDADTGEPVYVSRAAGASVQFEVRSYDNAGNVSGLSSATVVVGQGPPPDWNPDFEGDCPTGPPETPYPGPIMCSGSPPSASSLTDPDDDGGSLRAMAPPECDDDYRELPDSRGWIVDGTDNSMWKMVVHRHIVDPSGAWLARIKTQMTVNFNGRQARLSGDFRVVCGDLTRGTVNVGYRFAEPNNELRRSDVDGSDDYTDYYRWNLPRRKLHHYAYRIRFRMYWVFLIAAEPVSNRKPYRTHRIHCEDLPERDHEETCRFQPGYYGHPPPA